LAASRIGRTVFWQTAIAQEIDSGYFLNGRKAETQARRTGVLWRAKPYSRRFIVGADESLPMAICSLLGYVTVRDAVRSPFRNCAVKWPLKLARQ
jgi:hypothetical protein